MLYTTAADGFGSIAKLFYQDFKDTFVCYTQPKREKLNRGNCCFIRILKILLYAIHNPRNCAGLPEYVVLSGF